MQKKFISIAGILAAGVTAVLWLTFSLQTASGAVAGVQTDVLYDGRLGTLPAAQGFTYLEFPAGATQTISNGGVILDTTASAGISAGYFNRAEQTPTLDRSQGFTVTLTTRILAESHLNNNRAGFSLIVLSSDLKGLELGFWSNEIWAQDDDSQDPGNLFTHAEGVAFATTTAVTTYTLHIITDTYTLSAAGAPILSGPVRDYTNFSGFPDPYETPNLIFLGDDTTSAAGRAQLNHVSVTTHPDAPYRTFLPYVSRE